jgi:hypothetical protein
MRVIKSVAEDGIALIKLLYEGRRAIVQARTDEPKATRTKIMPFKFMSVLMRGGRLSKAGERKGSI